MREEIYKLLQKFKYKSYSIQMIKTSLLTHYKDRLPEALKVLYWNTEWAESLNNEHYSALNLNILEGGYNFISDIMVWNTDYFILLNMSNEFCYNYTSTFELFNNVVDVGLSGDIAFPIDSIPYEEKIYLQSDLYNVLSEYCLMLVDDRFDVAVDRDFSNQRRLYYSLVPVLKPYGAMYLFKVLPVVPVINEELYIVMIGLRRSRNYYVGFGDVIVLVNTYDISDFNLLFNKFAFLSLYGGGKISVFWVFKDDMVYKNAVSRVYYDDDVDYTQQFINRILWEH